MPRKLSLLGGAAGAALGGVLCLACVLPVLGAIIGVSAVVTALGGIAEDGMLVIVGVVMLACSGALAATYVFQARRRGARCAPPDPAPASRP